MEMSSLLRAIVCLVFVAATMGIADARSWNWTYSDTGVQGARGLSSATLELGSNEIKTSNRIAIAGHPDVVYGCTIKLGDVAHAIAVHTGPTSLLIELKPDRTAACQVVGPAKSVVLRADDGGLLDRIAGAINNACCAVAAAPIAAPVSRRTSIPEPRPATTPRATAPRPSPTAPRVVAARGDADPRLVRSGIGEPVPGKSGVIRIRVHLGPDGRPQDAAIISSTNDDLDDAGVEIAVSSIYAPAVHGGRQVAADFIVTISFVNGSPGVNTSAR
jgi:hypothetical protein